MKKNTKIKILATTLLACGVVSGITIPIVINKNKNKDTDKLKIKNGTSQDLLFQKEKEIIKLKKEKTELSTKNANMNAKIEEYLEKISKLEKIKSYLFLNEAIKNIFVDPDNVVNKDSQEELWNQFLMKKDQSEESPLSKWMKETKGDIQIVAFKNVDGKQVEYLKTTKGKVWVPDVSKKPKSQDQWFDFFVRYNLFWHKLLEKKESPESKSK